MLNFIIFGAPGCGKGTQSAFLVEKYHLKHLSTGELLRTEIQSQTKIGKLADRYIKQGNLVPDDLIIHLLFDTVDRYTPYVKGFIFDGFPRTVKQAVALEKEFEIRKNSVCCLFDIQVENDELIKRLLIRGETSGRTDDNLETINKRLDIYHVKTEPVIEFYKKLGKYRGINGTGEVVEIFNRISTIIDHEL